MSGEEGPGGSGSFGSADRGVIELLTDILAYGGEFTRRWGLVGERTPIPWLPGPDVPPGLADAACVEAVHRLAAMHAHDDFLRAVTPLRRGADVVRALAVVQLSARSALDVDCEASRVLLARAIRDLHEVVAAAFDPESDWTASGLPLIRRHDPSEGMPEDRPSV